MNKCIIKTATVALVTMSANAAIMEEKPEMLSKVGRRDPSRLLLSIDEDREDQANQSEEEQVEEEKEDEKEKPSRRRRRLCTADRFFSPK